jgi:hypothetical protein
MLPHRDSRLTRLGLIVFFAIIVLYALYEAQGLLFGPKILVSTETVTAHDPYVKIEGRAERIASLSMNGRDIPVTERGEFSEPFLLAKGQNRITLKAKDTYGRTVSRFIDIFYTSEDSASIQNATLSTTTPQTAED